ncbi:putative RTA1 like protein-domain-containing protein [Seiridium cardinale]
MANSTMEITALPSCTSETCPISLSPYGYRPDQGVNIVFLLSFTSSFMGLQIITLYTRQWLAFSIPLCIASLFEVIGYAARIGSWSNPWGRTPYAVTEFFLTIAPTLVSSSIYVTTERMLFFLGPEHSMINPRWYRLFIVADMISFAVQIAGLGVAIWDVIAHGFGPGPDKAGRVIAVGVGIHVLMLTVFLVFYTIALIQAAMANQELGYTTFNPDRGGYGKLTWRFRIFLVALLVGVVCLVARGVYRTIGFVEGFDGGSRIEGWFALLDGLLTAEAVLGLVVLHPSYVFTDYSKEKEAGKLNVSRPVSYGKLARQVMV